MLNGKELILNAVKDLNESKLLSFKVELPSTFETLDGENLENAVNYFLDSVETIPGTKETFIPKTVIHAYNSIIDKAVSFETTEDSEPFNIDTVVFRRTKFYE